MKNDVKKFLLVIIFAVIFSVVLLLGQRDRAVDPTGAAVPGTARLAELLSDDDELFPLAVEGRRFRFPDDHGPHPDYRNEWWYVTGNVDAAGGERFGFELTLFRFSLRPTAVESPSAWRSNQVYIGHFAITDAARRQFRFAERYSRGSLGLAGAQADPFRVWLDDWGIAAAAGGAWRLRAADRDMAIDVTLDALKEPVLNGVDGYSQKSAEVGNASYYYSITRMRTEGEIRIDGRTHPVTGLAWLDREWGSSALSADQAGWDWFALQLDDGSELMFYSLRRLDGTQDRMSAGTFVDADGRATHLRRDDVTIDVLDHWDSPAGGRYPIRWRLRSDRLGAFLMHTSSVRRFGSGSPRSRSAAGRIPTATRPSALPPRRVEIDLKPLLP